MPLPGGATSRPAGPDGGAAAPAKWGPISPPACGGLDLTPGGVDGNLVHHSVA